MFQITADLSSLSKAQREAVADFILTFPQLTDDEVDEGLAPFSFEPSPDEIFALPAPALGPALVTDNDRLDKAGLPWDERIHSSSRVKTADGLWRKKRGVDEAVVTQVEGELKALMRIPAPVSATVQNSIPIPPVTIMTSVPAPPPPPAVDDRQAFVNLITLASQAIGAKTLTQEQLTAAVVAAGVPSLPLLGNRLDLVPQVASTIQALIAAAQ
jgi:hypothetical protein